MLVTIGFLILKEQGRPKIVEHRFSSLVQLYISMFKIEKSSVNEEVDVSLQFFVFSFIV